MKLYVVLNIILCFSGILFAQETEYSSTIEMGSKTLRIDEPFVISLVLEDVEARPSVIFPDIAGLEKRGKSVTSSVSTIEGKKVVIQTISQEYFANKIGKYQIPDFFVSVNGAKIPSKGTAVNFLAQTELITSAEAREDYSVLPEPASDEGDVFLSVQADKRSVYLREGFALRISLYVAESAPVEMEFYQFTSQLQSILKKLKPANCWEENMGIEEIIKRQVRIGVKKYTEYTMYQAEFFPITLQDVIFPSVSLNMLVSENKSAVNVKDKIVRSYNSRISKVKVLPLPEHPHKDQVAVGQYILTEKLSSTLVYPGESVRYVFRIQGVGNIRAIPMPEIQANSVFDFYPPDISQIIKRSYPKVTGEKIFDYFVVPGKDGTFPLSRYFQWIYFDPLTAKYDTLRPTKVLQVKGEDYKLGNISLSGSQGLYDNLEALDTTKVSVNYKRLFKDVTNAIVVVLLIAMIWVYRK